MGIDFSRLRVEKLIVHEVPGKFSEESQLPILSTIETQLSMEEKRYFTRKITENLSLASFAARFMPDAKSPIPQLVVDDFFKSKNDDDFVKLSQKMATYLYDCQTRVNPPGLLAVIEVSIAKQSGLVILKLEKEEGIRIEQNKSNGQVTFDVEYISNILLSEKNRIFKAGLFYLDGNNINIDNIYIYITDNQNSKYSQSNKIASFFLKDFLGCQLRDNPSVITQKFFNQTESFINKLLDQPEEQATSYLALLAELRSGDNYLSPESFGDKYFQPDKKQQYIDNLKQAGIPTNEFAKNTELLKEHLSKVQLILDSGIIITLPSTAFQEELKLSGDENGKVHIEIEDKLKQLKRK